MLSRTDFASCSSKCFWTTSSFSLSVLSSEKIYALYLVTLYKLLFTNSMPFLLVLGRIIWLSLCCTFTASMFLLSVLIDWKNKCGFCTAEKMLSRTDSSNMHVYRFYVSTVCTDWQKNCWFAFSPAPACEVVAFFRFK